MSSSYWDAVCGTFWGRCGNGRVSLIGYAVCTCLPCRQRAARNRRDRYRDGPTDTTRGKKSSARTGQVRSCLVIGPAASGKTLFLRKLSGDDGGAAAARTSSGERDCECCRTDEVAPAVPCLPDRENRGCYAPYQPTTGFFRKSIFMPSLPTGTTSSSSAADEIVLTEIGGAQAQYWPHFYDGDKVDSVVFFLKADEDIGEQLELLRTFYSAVEGRLEDSSVIVRMPDASRTRGSSTVAAPGSGRTSSALAKPLIVVFFHPGEGRGVRGNKAASTSTTKSSTSGSCSFSEALQSPGVETASTGSTSTRDDSTSASSISPDEDCDAVVRADPTAAPPRRAAKTGYSDQQLERATRLVLGGSIGIREVDFVHFRPHTPQKALRELSLALELDD